MSARIPRLTVNNIILNIGQSNMFGNSIIETVYSQLDFIRDKQIMDIKALISKIPNKISVVSVLFFIPLLLTYFIRTSIN